MKFVLAVLLGTWVYDGFLYEGHRYPKPNADLTVEFVFQADGISRLMWESPHEGIFCERLANFDVRDDVLHQKTFWLNPKNSSNCQSDQDMQPDRETNTTFLLNDEELQLLFELDGEPFYYILKKFEATADTLPVSK